MILEHWCDFNEERELADYNGANGNAAGFMLWANATNSYQEASMGYSNNDLSWANFQSHNFQDRHAVAYAESHDEERLVYKNLEFGNSSTLCEAKWSSPYASATFHGLQPADAWSSNALAI